jgi:hypothetical protein
MDVGVDKNGAILRNCCGLQNHCGLAHQVGLWRFYISGTLMLLQNTAYVPKMFPICYSDVGRNPYFK